MEQRKAVSVKVLDRTGSRRRPGSEKSLAKAVRRLPRPSGWGRGFALGGVVLGTLLVWGPSQADPGAIVHLVSTLSSCPVRDFSTLQEAVDCAVAGDSINIDAGTLREQVVITKALTIQGAGKDLTTIESPDVANLVQTESPPGTKWKSLKATDIWAVIGIRSDATGLVTLKNLTVDGRDQGILPDALYADKNAYFFSGVAAQNSDVTLDGIRVTGIRGVEPGLPPDVQLLYPDEPWGMNTNFGIFAESALGSPMRTLTVQNSIVTKFQKTALIAWGPTLVVDIHDNVLQGYGQTLHSSGNGIQIGATDRSSSGGGDRRGTSGKIYNNQILGFGHVVPVPGQPGSYLNLGQGGPTGVILTYAASNFEIYNNTITGPGFNNWYNGLTSYGDGSSTGFINAGIGIDNTVDPLIYNNTISGFDIAINEFSTPAGSHASISNISASGNGIDYWTGGGNDQITLKAGVPEVVALYAPSTSDNGLDTLTGFGTGDRIYVFDYVAGVVNGNVGTQVDQSVADTESVVRTLSYTDPVPVVNFTGGTVTAGDGSNVAAKSVQVSSAANVTTLHINTTASAGPGSLKIQLAGVYVPADFALSGGFINYVPSYTVSSAATPLAGGSVSCVPATVKSGNGSSCTATASPGYKFQAWSGDCSGATCSLSNITANKSVTASFLPISVDNGGGGGGGGGGVGGTTRAELVGNSCSGFETYSFQPIGGSAPNGDPYAYASFSFKTSCASATVKLTFPSLNSTRIKFWKYYGGQWHDWTSRATINSSDGTITFTVVDNGEGDNDPAAGVISDPVAVSLLPLSSDTMPIPTLSEWARMLLMAVVAATGLFVLRRGRA